MFLFKKKDDLGEDWNDGNEAIERESNRKKDQIRVEKKKPIKISFGA